MKKQQIRLTSQCNYQCFYCPVYGQGAGHIPPENVLSECVKAAGQGVCAIELGGGEPLLYPGLAGLIHSIKHIDGIKHVSIFTNGSLLKDQLDLLKEAGLDAVQLHMDVPDASAYARITGRSQILNEILDVIWAANAKDIPLTITVYLHKESKAYLPVMAGFARKFAVTICYVEIPGYSKACGLDEQETVRILRRSIKDLAQDGYGSYTSPALKGLIRFEAYCRLL